MKRFAQANRFGDGIVVGVVLALVGLTVGALVITPGPLTGTATTFAQGDGGDLDPDGDEDKDGLTNAQEAELGTDPYNKDSDGDFIMDGREVNAYKTNPNEADSDGDGVDDSDEIWGTHTDPNSTDSDGDGVSDYDEDFDGDGLPNGVELDIDPYSNRKDSYPDNPDSDGDGIPDGDEDHDGDGLSNADEVAMGSDPKKDDTDLDGLSDGAERDAGTDPTAKDSDGDGLEDADEIADGSDPMQADSDADGIEDGVEKQLGLDPNNADSDGSGVSDAEKDSDGDGVSNLDEIEQGTNPDAKDSDGDGIDDGAELEQGLDPSQADSDGDGWADGVEVMMGTNPHVAESKQWMDVYLKLGEIDVRYAKLYRALFSPNPDYLVVSDQGSNVALFSVAAIREGVRANESALAAGTTPVVQPEPLLTLNAGAWVEGLAFTPDDALLATVNEVGTLALWRTADGALAHERRFGGRLVSVAISPTGDVIAVGADPGQVIVLPLAADGTVGEPLATLAAGGPVWSLVFSPDGGQLAYADGNQVHLWDVAAGADVGVWAGHADQLWALAFSPAGDRLASGSWDGTVIVWDTASGDQLLTLTGHTRYVGALAFTGDGSALVSGSGDSSVRLWDTASGELLRTIDDHADKLGGVAFHPQDDLLLTASWDGAVFVWGLPEDLDLLTGTAAPPSEADVGDADDATGAADDTPDDAQAGDDDAASSGDESGSASDVPATGCTVSAAANVNLRGGPGTTFDVVGTLEAGQSAVVTGQATGADSFVWWYLDRDAWARSDVVATSGDCAAVPVITP